MCIWEIFEREVHEWLGLLLEACLFSKDIDKEETFIVVSLILQSDLSTISN
jgi:hypothetical protein